MCLKRVNEILVNPSLAIKEAKKEKCMCTTLTILLFEWILIAIGSYLLLHKINLSATVFFLGLVGTLLMGFLVQLVFTVLGGKGGFFEGLTSIVYAILPEAASILLASIFIMLPVFGLPLSFITLIIFVLLSISILYRSVKDMFSTDMITAMVGISILAGSIAIAFYVTFLMYAVTSSSVMSFIPSIS